MKKNLFVLLLLVAFSFEIIQAQEEKTDNLQLLIKFFSLGNTWSRFSGDRGYPPGLPYCTKETYDVQLAMSAFFGKNSNWGIDVSLVLSNIYDDDKFDMYVRNNWSSDYYYLSQYKSSYSDEFVYRFGSGVCYKYGKKRFIIITKALIGVTSFKNIEKSVSFKKKDSNDMYLLNYVPSGNTDSFTIMPCVSFGFRLNRILALTFDAMYSVYRNNFSYTETFTDLYTDHQTLNTYKYKGPVNNLSISFGLAFTVF